MYSILQKLFYSPILRIPGNKESFLAAPLSFASFTSVVFYINADSYLYQRSYQVSVFTIYFSITSESSRSKLDSWPLYARICSLHKEVEAFPFLSQYKKFNCRRKTILAEIGIVMDDFFPLVPPYSVVSFSQNDECFFNVIPTERKI